MTDKSEDEKLDIVRQLGKRVQQDMDAMPKVELPLQGLSIFLADLTKGPEFQEGKKEDSK
ncbi:MAG: hypothetical protein M0P76_06850 [Candidatus Pacebacteria bacterium]|jgi:hypothetical protein|nr:hypothetical protein [Candidatus Paceibacterota bacterium]